MGATPLGAHGEDGKMSRFSGIAKPGHLEDGGRRVVRAISMIAPDARNRAIIGRKRHPEPGPSGARRSRGGIFCSSLRMFEAGAKIPRPSRRREAKGSLPLFVLRTHPSEPFSHSPLRASFGRDDDLIGAGMWGGEGSLSLFACLAGSPVASPDRPYGMRRPRLARPSIDLRSMSRPPWAGLHRARWAWEAEARRTRGAAVRNVELTARRYRCRGRGS